MQSKALTAAQIDTLSRRLSDTRSYRPPAQRRRATTSPACWLQGSATSATPHAFTTIMAAATFEQAEARPTLVLDYGNTEPVTDAIPVLVDEPKAATARMAVAA